MCFKLDCEPPTFGIGGKEGIGEAPLLMSRPNVRAPLVRARGRVFVLELVSSFFREGARENMEFGGGDMSMRSARSLSGVPTDIARGGELRDIVEANESSRSDDRNSSTSSWGCGKGWLRLCEGAAGGAVQDCILVADKAKKGIS